MNRSAFIDQKLFAGWMERGRQATIRIEQQIRVEQQIREEEAHAMKLARITLTIEAETEKRAEQITEDIAKALSALGYSDMVTIEEVIEDAEKAEGEK
jgi:hypothetical protein